MEDELVLLTSYFNLAGGRRQDNAATFRVDPSLRSATSPDGVAALYVVTESTTGGQMGPRARKLAADTVVQEYASHGDVPPATRLRTGLKACHEGILREFEGHVSVGVSVVAVERDSIYLAQVAPGQVYVVHAGGLHSVSAAVEGSSPFSRALGASAGPKINVFRDQIGPGDVLALTSSWFHRAADPEEIRDCFSAGTADDVAQCILEMAKQHDVRDASVIVIEAAMGSELEVDSDDDPAPSFVEQLDTAVASLAGVGRMIWDEFRTTPPVEDHEELGLGRRRSRQDSSMEDPDGSSVAVREPESRRRRERPAQRDDPTMEVPRISTNATDPNGMPAITEQDTVSSYDIPAPRRDQATEEMPIVSSDDFGAREAEQDNGDDNGSQTWPESPQRFDREATTEPGHADDQISRADELDAATEEIRQRRGRRRGSRSIIRQDRQRRSDPEPEPTPTPAYRSELDQVNARIHSDPDIGDAVPPVQAFPDTSTEPSRIYATSKDIQAVNRRPRRFGGIARPTGSDPLSGTPVIRPNSLGDIDLRQSVSRPVPGPLIWVGVVACFLLFAVAAALYLRHRHTPTVAVNPYPKLVQKDLRLALAATAPGAQDGYLAKARSNLSLASQHGSTKTYVARMQTKISTAADSLHHITREVHPVTLTDFSKFPQAHPVQIATSPGLVFVLDTGRKSVYSVTPNATSNPGLVVQAGETDSGFTIGLPRQLATAGSTALVLDDHSVLVRASGTSKTATSLTAGAQNLKVAAIANTGADVYLLDTGSGQLWRYQYGVAGFNPPPQAFFTSNKPDLTHARSLAFDSSSLYVLSTTGSVRKFDINTANPQPFTVHARTPLRAPSAVFTDVGLNNVWVADPPTGRIVQLDKAGNYQRTYMSAASSMDLSKIDSIAVGPAGNTLYVLSGAKLYDFPVVH
jgi:hypothetical protein